MANIFASLRQYAGKWAVKSSRNFTEEEISAVSSNQVVASQYGNSLCFFMTPTRSFRDVLFSSFLCLIGKIPKTLSDIFLIISYYTPENTKNQESILIFV